MKRQEIMSTCPEEAEEFVKDLLDEFEELVVDIRDLLNITDISKVDQINEAYNLAEEAATDLY